MMPAFTDIEVEAITAIVRAELKRSDEAKAERFEREMRAMKRERPYITRKGSGPK